MSAGERPTWQPLLPPSDGADIGHMRFRRMDDMTPDDFAVLRRVHEQNPRELSDLMLYLLNGLGGDTAYPLDRKTHSLQAATRALRDGRDEEYVVVTLLHDIGEALGPLNHGEVIASICKPFVGAGNHWMLEHHPLFQTYYYGANVGIDPNGREAYAGTPYFDQSCGVLFAVRRGVIRSGLRQRAARDVCPNGATGAVEGVGAAEPATS